MTSCAGKIGRPRITSSYEDVNSSLLHTRHLRVVEAFTKMKRFVYVLIGYTDVPPNPSYGILLKAGTAALRRQDAIFYIAVISAVYNTLYNDTL